MRPTYIGPVGSQGLWNGAEPHEHNKSINLQRSDKERSTSMTHFDESFDRRFRDVQERRSRHRSLIHRCAIVYEEQYDPHDGDSAVIWRSTVPFGDGGPPFFQSPALGCGLATLAATLIGDRVYHVRSVDWSPGNVI